MDVNRNDLLGALARGAALERTEFLVQATTQLQRFLDENAGRIAELGGLTLIDDEPDYLSVAPDSSFRSRARFQDEVTGEWISETEVIESAAELVELYNPADVFAAFAEAAREAAGLPAEPTGAEEMLEVAGISPEETVTLDAGYAAAADEWAATQGAELESPTTPEGAAHRLYDLSLTFQERSQVSEANLVEQFEHAASLLAEHLGDIIVIDDEDERLTLRADGRLVGEVVPEDADGQWRRLESPEELVEFYDPTDVFGDVADAIADAYPHVAPEFDDEGGEQER
ncbi:MAG: hypothetical protein H6Q36_72 [Chloroflexi bacterium]|jgi:hypothetical protein|nr:hypothetical protein [Chloroflexota bacterium]